MPSAVAFAGAGSCGVTGAGEAVARVGVAAALVALAPKDLPGNSAEASAARPAVNAAAPPSINRRVRLILPSAASRTNAELMGAPARSWLPAIVRMSCKAISYQ
jgi:hypothetical protein